LVLLGYARQVESLGEAVHARQDVGTAVGVIMERHGLDRERAFAFIARLSNDRNIRVRVLAQQIVDGALHTSTADVEDNHK
jgi:AmiR/NasT family two-component response regulator